MNIKCGTDIIEIARIQKDIEELQEKFLRRIYTEEEIKYCESKGKQKYQSYAARFAAKEAIFKAISEKLEKPNIIQWKNMEITNNKNGKPHVKITDQEKLGIETIDISLSHTKEYAIATTVIIFD